MSQAHRNGVPLRRRDVFFIETPKASESILYTVYSVEMETLWTHFNGGKTCPCYEDHSLCEPEHTEMNIRWKGYLFGYSSKRNEAVFAQLTLDAANQLMDQVGDKCNLRGMKIRLTRTAKNKGRLLCKLEEGYQTLETFKLPPVIPVRRSLFNCWRLPYNDHPFCRFLDRPEDGGLKLREVV